MKAAFKDVFTEYWLRKRNNGTLVWTTKEGKNIPIKDLSDDHLVNILNMFLRAQAEQEEQEEIMSHLEDYDDSIIWGHD